MRRADVLQSGNGTLATARSNLSMPAGHVVGVGLQVGPRAEVMVVELQLQVVGLQVGQDEDARDGAWELPEAVEDILCHDRYALFELLAVDLCAATHPGALLPGTRRIGMEGSSRTELPLGEGFDGGPHVRIVWRAVAREDPWQARRVRQRPALVGVVAEPQPGHLGVVAGPENRVAVDAIEHPASQAYCLQHQHASVAAGREFGGALGDGVLFGESQRQGALPAHYVR